MRKKVILYYYSLILILCSSLSFAFVMGTDDRVVLTEEESSRPAFKQIGQIMLSEGGFVSGLLMGKNCDVVISVGHASYYWKTDTLIGWKKGKLGGNGKPRFTLKPGRLAHGISMHLVKSGYDNINNIPKDKHDWSVYRLETAATDNCEQIKPVRNGISCKGIISMPAFHFDRKYTLLIDRTCRIKDSFKRQIIVHDCDSKEGASGAPIYCELDGEISLLGINVSGLSQKGLFDPGVYGQDSEQFHFKKHKNFAITLHSDFYLTLLKELHASENRARKAK